LIEVGQKVYVDVGKERLTWSIYSISDVADENLNYKSTVIFTGDKKLIWNLVNVEVPIQTSQMLIPINILKTQGDDIALVKTLSGSTKLKKWFFTFWIENYKVSFLFLFLIVVVGIISLLAIPKESSPDIKFGIISITTPYTGVNPEDIDSLITEKIEKEIEDIDGISKITSNSSIWISSVSVELENGVSTRDTMTDIKDRIDTIVFPSDADDPIVREISTRNELLFEALIYSEKELSNFALTQKWREIQSAVEGKNGISSIDIWWVWAGLDWAASDASDYDIEVLVSKAKLELLDISIASVANTLRSYNRNTPLGNFTIWDLNYDFRFDGEFESIRDLENTIIKWSWSSIVRLKDIANIQSTYDEDSMSKILSRFMRKYSRGL